LVRVNPDSPFIFPTSRPHFSGFAKWIGMIVWGMWNPDFCAIRSGYLWTHRPVLGFIGVLHPLQIVPGRLSEMSSRGGPIVASR
jgi:hypothetical protein